jgi:Uma2 family endonuclease
VGAQEADAMSVSVPRTEPVTPGEPIDVSAVIPPLEEGDRLSRDEFERRYDAMPHLKKAELIEGVVHVPSPVRQRYHGRPHSTLIGWLFVYEAHTPGVELGDNPSIRMNQDNMPQPDGVLVIQPEYQGHVKIDVEGYIEGAPDLVAEVAASSASYDLHDKLEVYRRRGIREYIVWRVLDGQIDWFVLRDGRYEKNAVSDDGTLRSTIFPGLWLDPNALLRGDRVGVLAIVERGLESPEHAAFAAWLRDRRGAITP